jgi:predicted permease
VEFGAATPPAEVIALTRELVHRISALPSVEAAGLTDALPLDRNRSWTIYVPGRDYGTTTPRPGTFVYVVGPGYFKAMGIQIRSGRDFADSDVPPATDKEPRAVVINETLAQILYPGEDPLGRPARTGDTPLTIVGVVRDVRQTSLDEAPASQMYLAWSQGGGAGLDIITRTALPASALVPLLRKTMADIDSRLLATDIRLIDDLVDRAVSPKRFMVSLLGGFSVLALILASLGIYGVVSYGVSQRTPEIGVRMALGATPQDVSRQVLRETLAMATTGVVIGGIVAFTLARVIGSLLYATSPTDPTTFATMAVVLMMVAAIAGYLPARRAARIDPMRALRAE